MEKVKYQEERTSPRGFFPMVHADSFSIPRLLLYLGRDLGCPRLETEWLDDERSTFEENRMMAEFLENLAEGDDDDDS